MEASDLTDHISRRFNKDIEDLRNNVLAMGGLVEAQLARAIAAIVGPAGDYFHRVKLSTKRDEVVAQLTQKRIAIVDDPGAILVRTGDAVR